VLVVKLLAPGVIDLLEKFDLHFPIWTFGLCIVCFPCPGHNELAARAGPIEISGFRHRDFARPRSPACSGVTDFLGTAPTLLPRPQVLQLQSHYHRC
jgi:hypothetical protein